VANLTESFLLHIRKLFRKPIPYLWSVLGENIVDPYMLFYNVNDVWDALEAKFAVSDA
jgi:hypothetical protein